MSSHGISKELEYKILKAFKEAEETCSSPWVLNYSTHLPGTSLNLQTLMTILGGIGCIISLAITIFLFVGHLRHWSNPEEQKQILRIVLFVPFFSLTSFFGVWFYVASGYLVPIGEYYEGFAISALFLFYVAALVPEKKDRALFFHNLPRKWYNGKPKGHGGSLRWFRIIWMCVFQIVVTRVATLIAIETLYSWTCPLSPIRGYGVLVANSVQGFSTSIAVTTVILFEKRIGELIQPDQPMFKLVSLKGIVIFQTAQSILFPALAYAGVFTPTPPYYVSYEDFTEGIPNFLLIWETVIMATLFLWSYNANKYKMANRDGVPSKKGPIRAFLSIFDLRDMWMGVIFPFDKSFKNPGAGVKDGHDSEASEKSAVGLMGGNSTILAA